MSKTKKQFECNIVIIMYTSMCCWLFLEPYTFPAEAWVLLIVLPAGLGAILGLGIYLKKLLNKGMLSVSLCFNIQDLYFSRKSVP